MIRRPSSLSSPSPPLLAPPSPRPQRRAFPKHHWGHHGYWGGFGLGFVDVAPVSDCYLVQTRSGRVVQVCN